MSRSVPSHPDSAQLYAELTAPWVVEAPIDLGFYELSYESIIAALMTLAILVLSEIIPKTLGANYRGRAPARRATSRASPPPDAPIAVEDQLEILLYACAELEPPEYGGCSRSAGPGSWLFSLD